MAKSTLTVHLKHPDDLGMDLAVEEQLVSLAAGDHQETKERMRREIRRVAKKLAGRRPAAEVRQLATTAALAWFTLRLYELQSLDKEALLFAQEALAHQRRVNAAHGRYLRTLKSLERARRRHAGDWLEEYERNRSLAAARAREEEGREVVDELLNRERPLWERYSHQTSHNPLMPHNPLTVCAR